MEKIARIKISEHQTGLLACESKTELEQYIIDHGEVFDTERHLPEIGFVYAARTGDIYFSDGMEIHSIDHISQAL